MSDRLPALKPKDVIRALEKAGFYVHHVTGSHQVLKHGADVRLRVVVPWHSKDLKRGTLRGIIESAGLTPIEFLSLL